MLFMDLNKNLKQEILNLYNIVGDDYFLIKQAIFNIKSAIINGFEEFDYVKLDAEKMKTNELNAQISALPISNSYRLIVLNNPSAECVNYLNKWDFNPQSSVVVCVAGEKLKNAELIDCNKLDKTNISKFILNQLSKNKLSIQEQALDYIIEATNSDMSQISHELNKIITYMAGENVITLDIVMELVANNKDYAIYSLTSAIDNKDYEGYQKILHELNKNQAVMDIFSYMGKYFKRMQYLCVNKNDEELSKILGIKPYAVKMSRKNVQKNGIKYYLKLYEKYIELDYKIKSGEISAINAMYELIF